MIGVLKNLGVFALASAQLAHASQRHAVIARNIANADTPGFKAQDVAPLDFREVSARTASASAPKATRSTHAAEPTAGRPPVELRTLPARDATPNGNTVMLEEQMVQAAETRGAFELAATLYAKNLTLLRAVVGRDGR